MRDPSAVIDWNGDSRAIADQINAGVAVTYAFGGEVSLSQAEPGAAARPELQAPGDFVLLDGEIVARCGRGYVTVRQAWLRFDDRHIFPSLHDYATRMSRPPQGRFHRTLHEDFDAVRAYARGSETVKELDGFRYAYFYQCLNRNTRFARSLVETFGLRPGSRFIDLACGTGWMAQLMAEHGLESHACDFFSPEHFPAELRAKTHYFQADIFEPLQAASSYDLVFLRDLTNEYRAADFDLGSWRVLFENLVRLAGATGIVYWIMMGGAGKIRAFDRITASFFPHRRYRISGYHAAILSQKPLPQQKRIALSCPDSRIVETTDGVFADLDRYDRDRLVRGVFSILNDAFAAVGYDFSRPVAVHNIPLAHKYFEWAARQRSFIKDVRLERLDPAAEALILCGDGEAAGLRQRFPRAVLYPVGRSELLDAWVNCPDFFVSEDQDGNYFEEFLRKLRERYDSAPSGAAGQTSA